MDTAKFIKPLVLISASALISQVFAQEGVIADYIQPPKATRLGHASLDGDTSFNVGITAYSVNVNFAAPGYVGESSRLATWPANGDPASNGMSGYGVPMTGIYDRDVDYLDMQFMCMTETGAPKKFRIDLYDGSAWNLGSPTNGGVITLTGTAGVWTRYRTHRLNNATDGYGNVIRPTNMRMMAIMNTDNTFPAVGGVYNAAAGVSFDCFRISLPRRLNGLYKISGTTNKNVGSILLGNGGGLLQYNDWIQNLGNVEVVNIFGDTSFGSTNTASHTAGLMYTYLDGGSVRQFGLDRLNPGLSSIKTNSWLGTGVTGNPTTDRFFGFFGQPGSPTATMVLRQVTTGVFSHYVRTVDHASNTYASEVPISLGGERLVAVGDVNGDGMDDAITRQGTNLRVRHSSGTSGVWPNKIPTFTIPSTLTTFGYLKVVTVADFNDDGIEDLILNDTVSGDVFSLMVSTTGTTTLTWLFQLNLAQQEKIHAAIDADNDGFPDIYSTRQTSPGVGEVNIRKMNANGLSVSSIGSLTQFNYTTFKPCAIGDINGDGTADVLMLGNDAPNYTVTSYLVNPLTRGLLRGPLWVCNANTATVRPIYGYGPNEYQ